MLIFTHHSLLKLLVFFSPLSLFLKIITAVQLRHGCTARRAISTKANLPRVLQAAATYAGVSCRGLYVLKQHTHECECTLHDALALRCRCAHPTQSLGTRPSHQAQLWIPGGTLAGGGDAAPPGADRQTDRQQAEQQADHAMLLFECACVLFLRLAFCVGSRVDGDRTIARCAALQRWLTMW